MGGARELVLFIAEARKTNKRLRARRGARGIKRTGLWDWVGGQWGLWPGGIAGLREDKDRLMARARGHTHRNTPRNIVGKRECSSRCWCCARGIPKTTTTTKTTSRLPWWIQDDDAVSSGATVVEWPVLELGRRRGTEYLNYIFSKRTHGTQ